MPLAAWLHNPRLKARMLPEFPPIRIAVERVRNPGNSEDYLGGQELQYVSSITKTVHTLNTVEFPTKEAEEMVEVKAP